MFEPKSQQFSRSDFPKHLHQQQPLSFLNVSGMHAIVTTLWKVYFSAAVNFTSHSPACKQIRIFCRAFQHLQHHLFLPLKRYHGNLAPTDNRAATVLGSCCCKYPLLTGQKPYEIIGSSEAKASVYRIEATLWSIILS